MHPNVEVQFRSPIPGLCRLVWTRVTRVCKCRHSQMPPVPTNLHNPGIGVVQGLAEAEPSLSRVLTFRSSEYIGTTCELKLGISELVPSLR